MSGRRRDWLVWTLAAAGVALRARQYLAGRSLWLDEATLVDGVASRSLGALLTEPLPGRHVAPPGFVASLWAALAACGASELAVRLPAFVAGCATVAVAVWVAGVLFRTAAARAALVGLVAGAPALVYYAAEAKPYAFDALAALGMLGLAVAPHVPAGALAAAGVLAPWWSHAAGFAMIATVAVRGARVAAGRRWRDARHLGVVVGAWGASGLAAALLTWQSVGGNPLMGRMWRSAFAPLAVTPAARAWYERTLADLVAMAFERAGPQALSPGLWWAPWLDVAVPVGTALGLAVLLWRRPAAGWWMLAVIAAALTASSARRYPLSGRLLLFAVPLVFVGLGAVVEVVASGRSRFARAAGWMLAASCLGLVAGPAVAMARRPLAGADVRGALAYVAAHAKPGDRLAPSAWSEPAMRFYRVRFPLPGVRPAPPVPTSFDAEAFVAELRRAGASGRVWIVLSHRYHERHRFLAALGRHGRVVDSWSGDGAGAFLFECPD